MPTGYTNEVSTGKVQDFRQFAMICARAMGALIHMRDDPLDAPIKASFPSTYAIDEAIKLKKKLQRFRKLTIPQIKQLQIKEEKLRVKRNIDFNNKARQEKKNYEAMLEKVNAWKAPKSLLEFKKFMITQLTSSIEYDCSHDHTFELFKREPNWTPVEFKRNRIKKLQDDIKYYRNQFKEECERCGTRNKWVQDLVDSLGAK